MIASAPGPEGEGYVGYQTRVDDFGNNRTERVTGVTVMVDRSETEELGVGQRYTLKRKVDFHSVAASDDGAVTVFCKTPTQTGSDGLSLVLKRPDQAPPPAQY